jgi:hypothetical protein
MKSVLTRKPVPAGSRTLIRCRGCGQRNLGIDIWCARCGRNLEWEGEPLRNRARRGHSGPDLGRSLARSVGAAGSLAGAGPRRVREGAATVAGAVSRSLRHATAAIQARRARAQTRAIATAERKRHEATAVRHDEPAAPQLIDPLPAEPATIQPPEPPPATLQPPEPPPAVAPAQQPRPAAAGRTRKRGVQALAGTARAVIAIVAVILIATLAAILTAPGTRSPMSARSPSTTPRLPLTAGSALAAAIPVVEASSGLRYTPGACPAGKTCLQSGQELTGANASVVQFSAGSGRTCAAYLSHETGTWRALSAVCAPTAQLAPLVGHPATVHIAGNCANARDVASLKGGIVACLKGGSPVAVDAGPSAGSGLLWWHLKGIGWMAQEFLQP